MDAIELLLSKNASERTAQTDFLVAGKAKDYAEYKHICGVIRGLDIADVHLKDLAERMEKSNE
jgi:hypothetical protein